MPPESLQKQIEDLDKRFRLHNHSTSDTTTTLPAFDWTLLGKFVLPVAATTLTLTNFRPKQFLRIYIQWGAKSGASDDYLRFNNNSGSNYTFIDSGGTARTSQTRIDLRDGANSALGAFSVIDIVNIANLVKSLSVHTINRITAAGTAQTFYQIFGTFVNTSAQINRLDLVSSNTETYPANSSVTVFGSKE